MQKRPLDESAGGRFCCLRTHDGEAPPRFLWKNDHGTITSQLEAPGSATGLMHTPQDIRTAGVTAGQPQQSQEKRPSFSREIQVLRAIAVLFVVVYHLWPHTISGGFIGVDMFFVVSGYLITAGMIREFERSGKLSLANFYARRARRILPAATLTIVTTAVVTMLVVPNTWWQDTTRHAKASLVYVENFLLARDSVDYLAQDQAPSAFQHFWSLSVEEQFYILWPVLFVLVIALISLIARLLKSTFATDASRQRAVARRVIFALLVSATIGSFVLSARMVSSADPAAYFVTHARAWELGVGALLAFTVHYTNAASRVVRYPRALLGAEVFVVSALVVGAFQYNDSTPFPGPAALLPTLCTAALIHIAVRLNAAPTALQGSLGRNRAKIVENKGVQWLGDVSYSLYLWHWPLIVLAPFMFREATPAQLPLLVLPIALAAAAASRKWIELPVQHGQIREWRPRRVLAATAALAAVALTVSMVPEAQGRTQLAQEASQRESILANPPEELGSGALGKDSYEVYVTSDEVLIPAPQVVRQDVPEGQNNAECKSEQNEAFTPRCEFGNDNAKLTVALVGDSHIEQYLPAFQEIAKDNDIRILTYFHAACPFSLAVRASDAALGKPCLASNEDTLREVAADDSIDLVVTSNRTNVKWDRSHEPDPTDGFKKAWSTLSKSGKDVVVLGDNPRSLNGDETRDCVALNSKDPSACAKDRDESFVDDYQAEAAEESKHVTFVDTSDWFCTDDICPAVVGNVMVYRDSEHITATYAATLTKHVQESIPALEVGEK